jgi:microcystin-dependent protein
MVSTYTTNTHLELQGTGDNAGTWGNELNVGDFNVIDSVFGAVTSITLSNANVTLSTSQTQANFISLNGALTANVSVIFPAIGRTFFMRNQTSGNFTVTLKTVNTGSTVIIPQTNSAGLFIVLDGTNVYADFGSAPPGKIDMFAMSAVPWGWLECNGQAVSRTTYSALFGRVGTTYGAGDGSSTFNVPDMRGYFPRGWDDGAGRDPGRTLGSAQGGAVQSHTHGVNDPGHSHQYQSRATNTGGTLQAGGSYIPIATFNTTTNTTNISIQSTGGTETRPMNVALLFAIKT